ncbi:hypothetical protein crov251 [Cafeteria roenbergensis virus]|uniref:Uncharacterized protein n=1 Tax=Cafeteria roenbergensis virus (strain BV-PW1) TaxID=693272 RepID=E3T521_CROVB|nr:hypothetical protein crov251 [Cafeteria roenbergensis virus BV-PW1]ADO67284.1 hypothetical protein crov251 [Cafeteria roenbergensis virus BV-PW1]
MILYEDNIKIGQHQLHFAKLYLNKVNIGYCPDIIIGEKINYPEEYLKYCSRKGTWIKPEDIKMIKCNKIINYFKLFNLIDYLKILF